MVLSIRNPKADALARQLARMDGRPVTEAVITALQEAIDQRLASESPKDTARRILARHGVELTPSARIPLDRSVYQALDGTFDTEPA